MLNIMTFLKVFSNKSVNCHKVQLLSILYTFKCLSHKFVCFELFVSNLLTSEFQNNGATFCSCHWLKCTTFCFCHWLICPSIKPETLVPTLLDPWQCWPKQFDQFHSTSNNSNNPPTFQCFQNHSHV